jgi:hypothetical protein
MKRQQLAMIAMVLNGKHKYFTNFDYLFILFNAFLARWTMIAFITCVLNIRM